MRIGVFGGSFNPVHNGHLRLASHAASELNLNKVVFIPSHLTPLKDEKGLLPAPLRVRLLRQALKYRPLFSVSLCEVRRGGLSYTVDTLKALKKRFKGATLFFLCGADTLKNISRWKNLDRVMGLCCFTVLSRPGHRPRARKDRRMLYVPLDALPVSSSEVRRRLKAGQSVKGLVPGETLRTLTGYYRRTGKGLRARK